MLSSWFEGYLVPVGAFCDSGLNTSQSSCEGQEWPAHAEMPAFSCHLSTLCSPTFIRVCVVCLVVVCRESRSRVWHSKDDWESVWLKVSLWWSKWPKVSRKSWSFLYWEVVSSCSCQSACQAVLLKMRIFIPQHRKFGKILMLWRGNF